VGSCENDDLSGYLKCGEFFDHLRNCCPLKDSAPWSGMSLYLRIFINARFYGEVGNAD